MKKPLIFFRNDDVRGSLDESLVKMTNLFVKHQIPVSHAVEPANVTKTVAEWLLETKKTNPDIIEIVQHGFDHKLKAVTVSGEFGGSRTFIDQLRDIRKGKQLMDKFFGDCWFPAFTFPYGAYNRDTLLALKEVNYRVISTGYTHSIKRMIFNNAGTLLRKKFMINKPVNYFNKKIPGFNLLELPTSINLTKKTRDENDSDQKSFNELKNEFEFKKEKFNLIGFLMHHRWWRGDDFNALDELLAYLNEGKYYFSTMEKLCD